MQKRLICPPRRRRVSTQFSWIDHRLVLFPTLGCAACHQGYSVLFASAIDAVNTLTAAQAAGQLKADLGKFLRPTVLILDLCEQQSYVE